MSYYSNGKRGTLDGAPIWRPKWWGELGNDAEFREATKPRTAFKAPYYAGGHRMTIDGIPVRVAAQVKDWAPWMKRALGKGTQDHKEAHAVEQQAVILFPGYVPSWKEGMASCLGCREEYKAQYQTVGADCWTCKRAEQERIAA